MPRAEEKSEEERRARRTEEKRSRGSISCAECRRLKLKCTKTVPCTNCVRRGCESICPNGKLVSGQGTRLLLASTDQLQDKIAQMSERIAQLEDALAALELVAPSAFVPVAKSFSNPAAAIRRVGSLSSMRSLSSEGSWGSGGPSHFSPFVGKSAGAEISRLDRNFTMPGQAQEGLAYDTPSPVSESMEGPPPLRDTISMRPSFQASLSTLRQDYRNVVASLPSWSRACQLRDIYLAFRHWLYCSVTSRQLCAELLPLYYSEASNGVAQGRHFLMDNTSTSTQMAHELGILLLVFALAAIVDITLPLSPYNEEGARYFRMALKVLSDVAPVFDCAPCLSTVQLLTLIGYYRAMSNENALESVWGHIGLASKLAQVIGLNRDSVELNLPREPDERRRLLFWELQYIEYMICLATGRHSTFDSTNATGLIPTLDFMLHHEGTTSLSFCLWKLMFTRDILVAVTECSARRSTPMSTIVALDHKIRAYEMPHFPDGKPQPGASMMDTMTWVMASNLRAYALLYLHRTYFAQSLYDSPNDPVKTRYALSFHSVYYAACHVIRLLKESFAMFPRELARVFFIWTHPYISMVMLASVAILGARSRFSHQALNNMKLGLDVFQEAAAHGGRPARLLPVVKHLYEKASAKYFDAQGIERPVREPTPPFTEEAAALLGKSATSSGSKTNSPASATLSTPPNRNSQSLSPTAQSPISPSQSQSSNASAQPSGPGVKPPAQQAQSQKQYQAPLSHTQPPLQHAHSSRQHAQPPLNHAPPPSHHGQPPLQLVQQPVHHARPSISYIPPPGPLAQAPDPLPQTSPYTTAQYAAAPGGYLTNPSYSEWAALMPMGHAALPSGSGSSYVVGGGVAAPPMPQETEAAQPYAPYAFAYPASQTVFDPQWQFDPSAPVDDLDMSNMQWTGDVPLAFADPVQTGEMLSFFTEQMDLPQQTTSFVFAPFNY